MEGFNSLWRRFLGSTKALLIEIGMIAFRVEYWLRKLSYTHAQMLLTVASLTLTL